MSASVSTLFEGYPGPPRGGGRGSAPWRSRCAWSPNALDQCRARSIGDAVDVVIEHVDQNVHGGGSDQFVLLIDARDPGL